MYHPRIDLVITMYQDEYTVQLTDTMNYPLNYPVVYRITGCSGQADNITTDCPTAGTLYIYPSWTCCTDDHDECCGTDQCTLHVCHR